MLGELIGAGASLLGGLMQNKQADKQADLQREFAQSGVQWKVQDAEKAGIHPLYALGAQTTSYQPTQVGDMGIAQAGQNIGRAIDATRSTPASAMALALGKIQLEGAQLDNEFKRVQLASAIRTNMPDHPALPNFSDMNLIDGQGNSGIVSSTLPGHDPRNPQQTKDLALWGRKWKQIPGTSDAQSWEDVYGDESVLPAIINNLRGVLDIPYNTNSVYQRNIADRLRKPVNPYRNQRPWAPRGRGY